MNLATELELNHQREVIMERLSINFHKIIPSLSLARGQFEFYTRLDQAMIGTIALLKGWLLDGHKADVRTEIDEVKFPSSPWQFFKQRYAPRWFCTRWPVVMQIIPVRVAVHHHYVCPHVAIEPSDSYGHVIHYMWMGEMSGQLPKGSCAEYEKRKREQQAF